MGPPLRRPPPAHRWWSAVRERVIDEVHLVGVRRVVGVAAGVLVAVLVIWWLLRPAAEPVEARLPFAAPVVEGGEVLVEPSSPAGAARLVLHVVGEVLRPGLVEVRDGARVADALEAAGGPTDDAQVHALNLAAPVRDGQRIHVPHRDDTAVGAAPVADGSAAGSGEAGGLIDLNQAGVDELVRLPGVGPSIAAAIVAYRDRRGPFASVDALLDVPGIGPAKLEALRDQATV